jgi:hypothetical protein
MSSVIDTKGGLAVAHAASAPPAPVRKPWDATFDIIKGALVVWMVVRHTVIIASTAHEGFFARYVNFLSGSFIFIMGYMIGRFAQKKFSLEPGPASLRLMIRGAKILLIFSALNFLIQASGFGNVDKASGGVAAFLANMGAIYTGDARVASFIVLLPIGYLLLLAPLLLAAASGGRRWAAVTVLVSSLVVGVVPATPQDSLVIKFMLGGVAAIALGQLTQPGSASGSRWRWLLIPALLAGGIWISGPLGVNITAYTAGIALVLVAMYWAAGTMNAQGAAARSLAMLGRYSLVGYILQILLIQLLLRALGGQRLPVGPEIAAIGVVTLSTVFACCWMLEWMRARSRGIDGAYRLVFS